MAPRRSLLFSCAWAGARKPISKPRINKRVFEKFFCRCDMPGLLVWRFSSDKRKLELKTFWILCELSGEKNKGTACFPGASGLLHFSTRSCKKRRIVSRG